MNSLILAAALAAGCTLVSAVPASAAAKNYDCSKAGNANKAACKGAAAKPAAPSAKATTAPKAAPKVAATTMTKATTTRNYDCSKAGNANKAQCKASAKVASTRTTTTKSAPAAPAPGMFQKLKNAMSGSPVAAPRPAAAPTPRRSAPAAASVEDRNPAGAIAQCKDGTYSHSKTRTGACSRHGGVGKWS
jgi:Protein of unknown function (DUF3761)